MRPFIFLTTGIVVLSVGFVVYVRMTTKPVIQSGLSSRAKEYIEIRRNTNDKDWQRTTVDKEVNPENIPTAKTIDEPECFYIKVPIAASEVRKEGECQYKVFLADPVGFGVFFKRSLDVATIEDVPDVRMRRIYKEQYSEEKKNVGDRTYFVFKKIEGGYEKTAFLLENKELYAFTLRAQTNRDLDSKFDAMLSSVKIYTK